jgi:hypothetical protein
MLAAASSSSAALRERPAMDEVRRPAAVLAAGREIGQQGRAHHNATPRKWQAVLAWFLKGGSLNRWEAYRRLRDPVLSTTISQLQQRGLTILRRDELVEGPFGFSRCVRYRLAPQARQRARELLGLPTVASAPRDAPNALEQAEAAA